MSEPGYHDALRLLCQDAGADLHRVLAVACEPVPARDPVVYLADFACEVLVPLAVGAAEQEVAGTMAGRAFTTGRPVTSDQDGPVRVWVPVVEQTTRTGVLAVTVPHAGPQILAQAELLGVFTGLVVAAAARVSDVPHLRRRDRAMSLPAGMQWDLLPPLSARTAGALIAGALEPAYDIAGDAFDYAINGADLHLAIFDGLGHGLGSTLLTGLAVGAYRHARRDGGIAELSCDPVLPFGLGDGAPKPRVAELEPDDAVLLYTDGVTEARTAHGELFGLDRLVDLLEREAASGRTAVELLRRLVRAVLEHQGGGLRDDATLLLVQWTGT